MDIYGLNYSHICNVGYSDKWDITRVTFDREGMVVAGARFLEVPLVGNLKLLIEEEIERHTSKLGQLL